MNNKEITKYIFLEGSDIKGDIAVVFGTWKAWEESVEKASELYLSGLVPKIIFSGGKNAHFDFFEGMEMAEKAVELGVKRGDILIEDAASNTLENVLFSIKVIEREIGLENIHSIIAVVKNFHARRALMTLRRHVPNSITLKVATYTSSQYPFTKEDWFESEFGRENVYREFGKIKKYLAKGDLAELNLNSH